MVVRQHDEGGAGRRFAHHLLRHRRQPRLDVCAAMPSSASARVSTTTARTGSSANAAASAWPTWPPPKIRHAAAGVLGLRPLAAVASRLPRRPARSPPRPGRRSIGRSRGRAGCRAASSLRPLCGGRRPSISPCALSIAMNSSWPPPIVPKIASGETSIQAPFSRGVEPFASRHFDQGRRRSRRRGRRSGFSRSRASSLASRAGNAASSGANAARCSSAISARLRLAPSAARPPSARAPASPARRGAGRSCGRRRSPPRPTAHAAPTSPA